MPVRPLPEEMMKYAQADTHYLLYVYDRLRADLFDAANGQPALIQLVWSRSKDLCSKVQLYMFILRINQFIRNDLWVFFGFFSDTTCKGKDVPILGLGGKKTVLLWWLLWRQAMRKPCGNSKE